MLVFLYKFPLKVTQSLGSDDKSYLTHLPYEFPCHFNEHLSKHMPLFIAFINLSWQFKYLCIMHFDCAYLLPSSPVFLPLQYFFLLPMDPFPVFIFFTWIC